MCIRDRVKHVQTAIYIAFHCRRATLRFLFRLLLDFIVAVSYTHLDVYKRQLFALALGKARANEFFNDTRPRRGGA